MMIRTSTPIAWRSRWFCCGLVRAQELIDTRQRLQLADHSGHRRPIVMDFRFFHPPLPIGAIEELERFVERLLRIVQYVRKCPPLPIRQKIFTGNGVVHRQLFRCERQFSGGGSSPETLQKERVFQPHCLCTCKNCTFNNCLCQVVLAL